MVSTNTKLAEAIKLAEDAMAYVPEYFANKHGMLRRMAALKEVAAHDAAQPLTDEQILMIGARALDKCFGTESQHVYITREVERAHGIVATTGKEPGNV